jgi:hypothetical protein
MSFENEAWRAMNEIPDDALVDVGIVDLAAWRNSLALVFDRFMRDYRRL